MPGVPQGRGEVGEAVASFPTYEAAQKAVSSLIAGDVPAKEIAIVGTGLRSIERVTGRLGYATAARSGAINGLLLGLFFSAIFVLGNPSVPISAFVGVLFVGIAFGMLLSLVTYALVRRRRDFASVMQVVADHYDVTVLPTSIHRARQIMGTTAVASPATVPTKPAAPAPATPALPPPSAPPRYGERVEPTGAAARPGHDRSDAERSSRSQPTPEPAPDDERADDDRGDAESPEHGRR